jgi:hypothetical protein
LILFRVIKYGRSRLFEPAFDQISIVYIALFGVLLAYWALVYWYEELCGEGWRLPARFGAAASAVVVTGMLMETCFPGFLSGPMGNMDELFRRVHLVKIKELQPVVPLHALTSDNQFQYLTRFSLWLGIIIPGIPVLLYRLSRSSGSERMAWAYILLASLVYLPRAFREIRWAPYVAILMLPGYAWLLTRAMQEITDRIQGGAAGILRITVLVASVIIFALPRAIAGDTDAESEASACPLIPVSRFLNDPQGWGGRPRKILAFTDFGPELLYRTRHSVFSIPSHRFHAGFSDSYHIMTALDDGQALEIIRDRQIELVLVCPGGHEDHFYARKDDKEIFHQGISAGHAPAWLSEIALPPAAAQSFRLYAVEYQSQ